MKRILLNLAVFCLLFSSAQAVQVINSGPDPRLEAWSKFGENFGKSFSQGFNEAYRKNQEEQERVAAIKNQIFEAEILSKYLPERHQEFVNFVKRSDLPEDRKLLLIYQLNLMTNKK